MSARALDSLSAEIRDIFAEVTRYPRDILDLDANLEEDLGIDSVKLGEIFSVLRERYHLPEKIGIAPDSLRTIGAISEALTSYLSASGTRAPVQSNGHAPSKAPAPANGFAAASGYVPANGHTPANGYSPASAYAPPNGLDASSGHAPASAQAPSNGLAATSGHAPASAYAPPNGLDASSGHAPASARAPTNGFASANGHSPSGAPPPHAPAQSNGPKLKEGSSVQARVREVFAEVTRYPLEILDVDANLEEDLGIDSVKLGEIFSVLREEYRLPEKLNLPRERLQSIAGICRSLEEYLDAQANPATIPDVAVPTPSAEPAHAREMRPGIADRRRRGAGSGLDPAHSLNAVSESGKPLSGKVGFISGSGRGLGKDIAVYLAELGATIVVNSFHSKDSGDATTQQILEHGGHAVHLWGSMANPAQLHRIFDEIEERYQTLDFFISNASNGMLASIEDLTVEHWEKAFRTNVVGLHQGALRAAKLMKRSGGGKIITLSSPAAHGYVEYFGCMGPVKAAVESLTRALAIELAKYNIQVNCVSPGPVDGELLRKWPESKRLVDQWTQATPLGRLCEHREVSHFIAYLLSEPVKAFTGSVLVLDGGISSQGW